MLITAAIEQGVINDLKLEGKEATRMRGRSRVSFRKQDRDITQGSADLGNSDDQRYSSILTTAATVHNTQANRLYNISKKMQKAARTGERDKIVDLVLNSAATVLTYVKEAARHRRVWEAEGAKLNDATRQTNSQEEQNLAEKVHIYEELVHMQEPIREGMIIDTLQIPRLIRLADKHKAAAGALRQKARNHAIKLRRTANSDKAKSKGIKAISKAIGEAQAKPIMFVKRDQDTFDGGKTGEVTTNPNLVDEVVRRNWKKIYDGVGGNVQQGIHDYFSSYAAVLFYDQEFQLSELTGHDVHQHFRHVTKSSGAMDGWNPRELAYLSPLACHHLAIMYNQIEEGRPWPSSTKHAKVAFLEKLDAVPGEVMSYRPLTMTSPFYREWASMRLRHLGKWIEKWQLDAMHAWGP